MSHCTKRSVSKKYCFAGKLGNYPDAFREKSGVGFGAKWQAGHLFLGAWLEENSAKLEE